MNELKERYVETALDELYNGGPATDLEQRILQEQAVVTFSTSRWWLVSAACVAVAATLTTVVLFSRAEPGTEDQHQPDAPAVGTREQEPASAEVSPVGLGSRYVNVEADTSEPEQPDAGKTEPKQPGASYDFSPDPDTPITIDFVQKDLHTVMHYIALRSGLQIIVEGEVSVKLTVMFRNITPMAAIQSICKANKLDYIEDGNVIIIKRRPGEAVQANIVKSEVEGLYNAFFEDHELIAAIMEVATVTKTQVFVPAVRPGSDDSSTESDERLRPIQEEKVNLYMRDATPAEILTKLAELCGLDITVIESDGEPAYKFSYRD